MLGLMFIAVGLNTGAFAFWIAGADIAPFMMWGGGFCAALPLALLDVRRQLHLNQWQTPKEKAEWNPAQSR